MDSHLGAGCSAWKLFLDLQPDSHLLILGEGLENLADNLAPNVGQLFVVDFDDERPRPEKGNFATSAAAGNISPVACNDKPGLSFADNSLDCVVLCGALEHWAQGAENTGAMQHKLLGEVLRILKPEGQIFLTADNLFGYERFRNGAGDHLFSNFPSGLRQWFGTGIYSFHGYRRLLNQAGFPHHHILSLLTDRQLVTEIIPNDSGFLGWQAPRVDSCRDRLKRNRIFVPAYGIIASAQPRLHKSMENSIFTAVSGALNEERGALKIHKYEITGKQKLIVHASSGKQRLLIKHTFDRRGTESEHNNHAVLKWLSEHRATLEHVPKPIMSGEINNQVYFAETAVHGRPLKQIVREDNRAEIIEAAMVFLRKINPPGTAEKLVLDGDMFEEYVGKRLAKILPFVEEPDQREQLLAFFHQHFLGKKMLLGVAHGDFSSSNILADRGAVSGVFDWEAGSVRNIAAIDGIGLLVSVHRAAGANLSLAECLALLATRQWPHANEFRNLMDLYRSMGIEETCHAGIVYLAWLNGMNLRLRYGMAKDPAAVQTYIHDVVSGIRPG